MSVNYSSNAASTAGGYLGSYTILAYPNDPEPGYLTTFCITDDKIIREFWEDLVDDFHKYHSWPETSFWYE